MCCIQPVFSLVLTEIVQGMVKGAIADIVFVIIYLLVWVFLSLISNSKVALLVNEIVSGIAATIFTIGTYLVSMALKTNLLQVIICYIFKLMKLSN